MGEHIRDTGASKIQDLQGLGYDSVVLPFLALLIGFCVALFQFGIEAMIICIKKFSADPEHSNEDDYTAEEAEYLIGEIKILLLDNHHKMGGTKFLSKIKTLSTPNA